MTNLVVVEETEELDAQRVNVEVEERTWCCRWPRYPAEVTGRIEDMAAEKTPGRYAHGFCWR
jgi:hypothetical protein